MAWRGTTTVPDRILACLPYLLPLSGAVLVGLKGGIFNLLPPAVSDPLLTLGGLLAPLSTGFIGLAVFFALFLLVVRNTDIQHFIRFNTMQALLIDFLLVACSIVLDLLSQGLGQAIVLPILYNTIFLGGIAAIIYAVVQSLIGRYAEIPTISDAVYAQVR
ncbi:Tic20 family protein [Leptolyngbya sp. FACHB-261]|uniref:Tic20 family protein n=1 Tax=Leptolyngbya sp. FACHB-261 TaxID=2692806 RepID=UPI001682A77E|nr:Tic20 family protein [Leptolyngbya sp. FACHB-261]MBD2104631.1 hypothetical protein [Leptolyngbya sp. FACHB-261]